jgi:2-furoyl-CoA dehydrogenase large subunit
VQVSEQLPKKPESKWVGRGLTRKEDNRLVVGKARFIDNLKFPNCSYAAILRSPYPRAEITKIDLSGAANLSGVRAILTGKEVKESMKPWPHLFPVPDYYGIAVDRVNFVGEPVAIVAAEDEFSAVDALERIDVEYKPLPFVTSIEQSTSDSAPLIHPNFPKNVAWQKHYTYGNVSSAFQNADEIISDDFYFPRYSSTPLDPTSCVATYEPSGGELTIYDQNQQSPMYHARYARVLNIPSNKIRVVNPDIGGGFGNKIHAYPYTALISLLAIKLGGTVRWVADRTEDMMAVMHSADRLTHVDAAVRSDGKVLGLRMRLTDNFGAFIRHPEPQNVTRAFPSFLGCYDIGAVEIDASGVFSNTCPTGANRGYGQQHSFFVLERMMDIIARKLRLTSEGIRFRNFIPTSAMPYETPIGSIYDGGDYPEALRKAMELIEYDKARDEQTRAKARGSYIGVGLANIVEGGGTTFGFARLWGLEGKFAAGYASAAEAAMVKVLADSKVVVAMGTVPQGQGHETVASQIVADELGLQPDDITVMPGFDSAFHPYSTNGSGTYSCRFSQIGVGALVGASRKVRDKMLHIAAYRLKTDIEDLELSQGKVFSKNNPSQSITVKEISRIAHNMVALLPPGMEAGLDATYTYTFPNSGPVGDDLKGNLCTSYANLAGAAVVEIDPGTFQISIKKLAIVHDSGTVLNAKIVKGQVDGATAHGVAGALYEQFVYGEDGQLLTSTFADYLPITCVEMPDLVLAHMESPSPFTPLGAKGCGEGGAILAPGLIANAVEDALYEKGVRIRDLPITPDKLWKAAMG